MYRIDYVNGTSGTAKSDINTIETWLALQGIHSDAKAWRPMKQLLKKLKTTHPTKKQKKRPFRESEIRVIFDVLKPTSIDLLVVRCILAFALCGALRGSEYTVPTKNAIGIKAVNVVKKQKTHRFIDASGNKSLIYVFFKSKTNQQWEAEYAVMPCCCKEELPCAYHELAKLESHITNLSENTHLFTWSDGTLSNL